jgi:hypothetical protein
MPQVTPAYSPSFPYQTGTLLFKGKVNGFGEQIFTQPGGPGTQVFPQPPTVNPQPNWNFQNYPAYPYAYIGLLNFGCGHWANTCEVYIVADDANNTQAALCCCPVCSFIQLIVEPAEEWWQEWYSLFFQGLVEPGGGIMPGSGG